MRLRRLTGRAGRRERGARAADFLRLGRVAAAAAGALLALGSAEAYRFFAGTDRVQPFLSGSLRGAADAVRWSSESWAPGATLTWEIASDPDFADLFGGADRALPYFREALAQWSEIPNADLRWSAASSVGAPVAEGSEEALQDGRNTFWIDGESAAGGYASLWVERGGAGEPWELFECDFALGSWVLNPRQDLLEELRAEAVAVITHELGHCLGLAHAASMSATGRRRQELFRSEEQPTTYEHPFDPSMSYGIARTERPFISADDIVAASLLRPAPGWRAGTGEISGSLRAGGEPAPWVHIWALPVGGDDPLWNRVGAFSDENGEFVIEGLAPGEYFLWAHPVVRQAAHGLLLTNGAPVDLDDTLMGYPVRVSAGQTAGPVVFAMRIGRTGRRPPDHARAAASPGSSIAGGASPCTGVRVSATAPYPADGPHATSQPSQLLGGDAWFTSELTMEWTPASAGVAVDWTGLYRNWQYEFFLQRIVYITPPRSGSPYMDLSLPRWDAERAGGGVRHTVEVVWPESAEAGLRFRGGSCRGERTVVCTRNGCGLR